MCDQIEIEDFFEKKLNLLEDKELFSDFQYIYVNDMNSGSYSSGQVQFTLTNLSDRFTILRDSFLEVPLQITSSGTAYTTATKLAIKNSLLSLIAGLQITTTDGAIIVNEQTGATPIIQNLKLFLESNIDWLNSLSQTIHYQGKDTLAPTAPGAYALNSVAPDVTTGIATTDYTSNQALNNRIQVLATQCAATGNAAGNGGQFNFIALIPLRLIHSVFDQFSFPMVNYPMIITFNISGMGGNTYQPFTCATAAANTSITGTTPAVIAAVAAAPAPTINIVTSIAERGYSPGACRLKMKAVKFHADTAKRLKERIQSGFKKTIQYTVTDYYKPIAAQAVTAGTPVGVNQLITNSAIRPVRLWCLPVAQGTTSAVNNVFPGSIGAAYLQQCNIQVNNENYYQNNLLSQYDFFKILETQQVGGGESSTSGAQISYQDWLNGLNPYVFDLSRIRQLDVNKPVSLLISCNLNATANGTYDLLFLVERLVTLEMDIKASTITSVVKQGTYN